MIIKLELPNVKMAGSPMEEVTMKLETEMSKPARLVTCGLPCERQKTGTRRSKKQVSFDLISS